MTTMTNAELRALAERVLALTGPDREVDAAVHEGVGGCVHRSWVEHDYSSGFYRSCAKCGEIEANIRNRPMPAFTARLDAAMTLVPEGETWKVSLCFKSGRGDKPAAAFVGLQERVYAATPALALTAAALLARVAQMKARDER